MAERRWMRRAREVLEPHLEEGERLVVATCAGEYDSPFRPPGRRPALIGALIGAGLAMLPAIVSGRLLGAGLILLVPFAVVGGVSGFEFRNRRFAVGWTGRRLLLVPRQGTDDPADVISLGPSSSVRCSQARNGVVLATDTLRLVLRRTSPEEEAAAREIVEGLGATTA